MTANVTVTIVGAFLVLLCFLNNTNIGVSAQCNDYSVVGLRDGIYSESCTCDIQVSPIPGCTNPPSHSDIEEIGYMQDTIHNISSQVDLLRVAVDKTSEEMEITQDDLDEMTTKLERIESGDLKVNRPEFDLIIDEIEKLEQVLVLLEVDRANNVETVNQLETELALVERQLLDLKKTQDVETLLEQIDQLEEELAQCKANVPPTGSPGSGDDDFFVPWDDIGTQDSCTDISSIFSSYTVRSSSYANGVWMRDPVVNTDTIWHFNYHTSCTSSSSYRYISSYPSYESYEQKMSSKSQTITLTSSYCPYGPGLAAYNGSIYFTSYNSRTMNRYDVSTGTTVVTKNLDGAGYSGSSYEYKGLGCSAIDFAVDETGLWVIYATSSAVIKVSRLDSSTLDIIQTWSLNFAKNSFGNCFIICAKLYCTDHYSVWDSKISLKFDTVTGEVSNPNIKLGSRFGRLSTLDYNPLDQKLYGWDNGNMVLYDIKFGNN